METHIHGQGNIFLSALNYKTLVFDTMNFSYVNVKLPSLGMLTSKKEASTIYQKKYQVDSLGNIINNDISWNNVTVRNAPAVTLKDGYELCVGKDENKYTYNIEFDSIECYNGAVKETDKNEIDIYLSYVPFSDSITTSEPVMLDNSTGTGTINHITTTGRKAKLQWTAKKSKVIYMKCKPHWSGTEYMDKDFTIVFNTKKNNIVEVESIGK